MSISAINVTNQSFTSKDIKPKKEKIYQRTDAFKIAGAAIGVVGAIGATIVFNKGVKSGAISSVTHELPLLSKGKMALVTLVGGILGSLTGIIPDYIINKTVKNTVLSLKKGEE